MSYTLEELAKRLSATIEGDPSYRITGIADLESAKGSDISFLDNARYEQFLATSEAGCIILSETVARPQGKNYLIAKEPSKVFQELIELFLKEAPAHTEFQGIHPTACVHPTATLGKNVALGPFVVIDGHVTIGDNSRILAHTSVGPHSTIGADCLIHSHVTIREGTKIGSRVIIQPGAVIGSCGFGYATSQDGKHTKLHHLGNVIIDDDVEIGANTTVDRARFQSTRIGKGTKIDNLVQLGHNVKVGPHNLIIAQTGIAGSAETGSHVILAGKVAVNGHIKIASGTIIAACSGVSKTITKPGKYGGLPCMPLQEYNKMAVHLQNIGDLVKEVKELKKKVEGMGG